MITICEACREPSGELFLCADGELCFKCFELRIEYLLHRNPIYRGVEDREGMNS
jgi:hypothetical protein